MGVIGKKCNTTRCVAMCRRVNHSCLRHSTGWTDTHAQEGEWRHKVFSESKAEPYLESLSLSSRNGIFSEFLMVTCLFHCMLQYLNFTTKSYMHTLPVKFVPSLGSKCTHPIVSLYSNCLYYQSHYSS